MKTGLFLLMMGALLTTMTNADAQADPRVADLVRAGKIRVALHLAQHTKDPVSGEVRGLGTGTVMVELAKELAARLGVKVQLVGYPSPPDIEECLKAHACDLGFGGVSRAAVVGVTAPVLQVDFTYLVAAGSAIRRIADADRPGIRIAVVRDHLSTLALTPMLKHAEALVAEVPAAAFDLLHKGQADVFASTRPVLMAYTGKLPGSQVLEERFGQNRVAMLVAKDQPGRLAYVSEFVEQAKASGLVQQAIERVGERGLRVAPVGTPAR